MTKIHPFLKGFLSNWYKSEFTVNGVKFVNSEQWMMYQKAKIFGDDETAQKILASTSPKEVKDLGRKIKNYNELTIDGKNHSYKQTNAILKPNTTVTCLNVYNGDNEIWLKIPSRFCLFILSW